jgi:hypothetical protein
MIGEAHGIAAPIRPVSLFDRIWPVAGLAVAAIVNLAWMGVIGYGIFNLAVATFSYFTCQLQTIRIASRSWNNI